MNYSTRIGVAAALSMLVHAAVLALGGKPAPDRLAALTPARPPLVLNFEESPPDPGPEPREEQPLRLVDAGAPADAPVEDTDLIAEEASKAQDSSEAVGENPRPFFEEPSEFDQMAQAEGPPAPPVSETAPPDVQVAEAQEPEPPAPEPAEESPVEEAPAPEPEIVTSPDAIQVATRPEQTAPTSRTNPEELLEPLERESSESRTEAREEVAEERPAERFKVAKAPEPFMPMGEILHDERGREGGGVAAAGPTSFEANQHVFAAYMKTVRNRVERSWRAALQIKYTGATPTQATLECAIAPDGKLVHVNIVDPGGSATFALLCKEAVERSAPFPAFPFEIPDIYRSQNLEIRWRFSFM